jgi:hypothetical protein
LLKNALNLTRTLRSYKITGTETKVLTCKYMTAMKNSETIGACCYLAVLLAYFCYIIYQAVEMLN